MARRGCSTGCTFRGRSQPRPDRRVRTLDQGRARLHGRGAPGRPPLGARPGRPIRAHRPGLSRLHDVARPDDRADRGHPAHRDHDRLPRRRPGLPRRAGRGRPRPRPDHPAPRLEHAQPGLRVRLLPRRPAPGQHLRAAGRRDRLRRLRDRRPAAEPGPRLAHPLQLAALPGRCRRRGPRADALAGAGTDHGLERRALAADPGPPGVPVRHGRQPDAGHQGGAPGLHPDPAENPYSRVWRSTSSRRSGSTS